MNILLEVLVSVVYATPRANTEAAGVCLKIQMGCLQCVKVLSLAVHEPKLCMSRPAEKLSRHPALP